MQRFRAILRLGGAVALATAGPLLPAQAPGAELRPWTPPSSLAREQHKAATQFESSTIDAQHTYTLPELADFAEQHNPGTRAAWAFAKVRAGQLKVARSDLLPTLTAAAIGGTSRQGVLFGSTFVRQTLGYYEPLLRVNYLILDFGDRAGRIEAAREQLASSDFAFNATVLSVLYETERRYFSLLNAIGQRTAAEVNLKNAETVRDAVNARLAVGLATLPDALEARAAAAQAQFTLQQAIGQVDVSRGDLLDVLGVSPLVNLKVQPLEELHLPEGLDTDVEGAIKRGLSQRPELGEQIAAKDAAAARVRQARSSFLPTLSFNGYGGEIRAYGQQDVLPSTYAGPVEVWDVRLELRWDLFEGGRRQGELAEAHAEQQRAQAEIERTRDGIENQVWSSYVQLRTAFHERDAATALLIAARSSYDAALRSYQLGVRNTVDVVTAQRSLAQALSADVTARTDVLTQLANFSYRIGDLLQAAAPARRNP